MKIAIVRLSSLGDIIFCMASLQLIRQRFPEAAITWFADSKFADILDFNPDLAGVVKVNLKELKRDVSPGKVFAEYRRIVGHGKFDLVIDMHGMIKSAVIAGLIGRVRCGFHRTVAKEPLSSLFYNRVCHVPLDQLVVNRYALLAAHSLGFRFDEEELLDKRPFLHYRDEDLAASKDFFRNDGKNIILVPGTSMAYKNYPKERYAAIANSLRENALVCYGSEDERRTAEFIAGHSRYATLLPRLNLNQLKAAISRADLVIGGDTGPTHMAWANNVPSITLYGATTPRVYHPTPLNRVIKSGTAVKSGKPDRHDLSIREIAVEEVLGIAEELLGRQVFN